MSTFTDTSFSRQVIFFTTGSIAGICSATADYGFDRLSSQIRGTSSRTSAALVKSLVPHMIRPGLRFWAFDIAKTALPSDSLSVGLRGGLAGAAGGILEMGSVNIYAMIRGSFRRSGQGSSLQFAFRSTLLHSCKLFLCFGSYTYLANTYSQTQPPRPFSYCLLLGCAAGAFGTMCITPPEMYWSTGIRLSPLHVFKTALSRSPRGAVSVGTVIAAQVTSSAWLLGRL